MSEQRPVATYLLPRETSEPDRRARWLRGKYERPRWVVSDTKNLKSTRVIDFRFAMPGGGDLLDFPRLYQTVKEYAWWIRDVRVGLVDHAEHHALLVKNLMVIAHRMVLDGIESFSDLQPYDIDQIVADSSLGKVGVLRAIERLTEKAELFSAMIAAGRDPFKDLRSAAPREPGKVLRKDVLSASDLPETASQLPGVAAIMDDYAKRLGLRRNYHNPPARAPQVVTSATVRNLLLPLEQLYRMHGLTSADTLASNPFPLGLGKISSVRGVPTVRTSIVPPGLVLGLLEEAVKVVAAAQVSGSVEEDAATACWILIAAFSARRYSEIQKLKENCISGDERSGYWLSIYIAKTLQREENIPVPEIVVHAVKLLKAITAEARKVSGSDRLFQRLRADGTATALSLRRDLDGFAKRHHVSVSPEDDDAILPRWHWHPHQFRRFFAVLYFYRHDGATVEAISHHLRHFSLDSTRHYLVLDSEAAAIWMDVEWGYMGDLTRSIASGERSVSGAMGERLSKEAKNIMDALRRSLRVVTPERVGAAVRIMMEREGLVLSPKAWVLCSCPSTTRAAAQAACRQASGNTSDVAGPDFAFAGPTVCPDCAWAILEERTWNALEREQGLVTTALSSDGLTGLFRLMVEAHLVEVRRVRSRGIRH